jgi:hypothetical protein
MVNHLWKNQERIKWYSRSSLLIQHFSHSVSKTELGVRFSLVVQWMTNKPRGLVGFLACSVLIRCVVSGLEFYWSIHGVGVCGLVVVG